MSALPGVSRIIQFNGNALKFLFDKKFVMRETQKTLTELFESKVKLIVLHLLKPRMVEHN